MISCRFCNNQNNDSENFCTKCGAKIREEQKDELSSIVEAECDVLSLGKPDFLTEAQDNQEINPEQPDSVPSQTESKKKPFYKNLSKKAKIFIAAAMALIITAGGVLPFVLPKKQTKEFPRIAFYYKNNALYVASLTTGKILKVADEITNGNNDTRFIFLNKEGSRVFYQKDEINGERLEYNYASLYYSDIDFKHEDSLDSVLIDSGIKYYTASTNGDRIAYIKSDKQFLIFGSVDSKKQIDSNVTNYKTDKNISSIFYQKINGDFCVYTDESGIKTIDTGIKTFYFLDVNNIYYLKDKYLFKYANGKATQIDSDVSSVYTLYNFTYPYHIKELYYEKESSETIKCSDLIEDDKKESDSALKRPVKPRVPILSDYQSQSEYDTAYKKYQADYYNNYLNLEAEYEKKILRDSIRQNIDSTSFTLTKNTLYYLSGNTTVKVSDNMEVKDSIYNENLFLFTEKSISTTKKNITSFTSVFDFQAFISSINTESKKKRIAYKGSSAALPDNTYCCNFIIDPSDKSIVFLGVPQGSVGINTYQYDQNLVGDIYKIDINNNTLGNAQIMESELASTYNMDRAVFYTEKSNKPIFFKKGQNGQYDLIVDNKQVDNLKSPGYIYTLPGSDSFVYQTTTNLQTMGYDTGYLKTLTSDIKIFDGKKSKLVAENASCSFYYGSDYFVYSKYKDENSKLAELYLYTENEEPILLDTDVSNMPFCIWMNDSIE